MLPRECRGYVEINLIISSFFKKNKKNLHEI